MEAGSTAKWTRRVIHGLCLTALAAWIVLAVPRLTPGLRLAGSFAVAAALAYDVATEAHVLTQRLVLCVSIAGYLAWLASSANPLSRPVVQTVVEAALLVVIVDSRHLGALLALLVALVFAGLFEGRFIYDPARLERMLWLMQACLFALATLVRGMRR